jgi:integrase/recombinase XerC
MTEQLKAFLQFLRLNRNASVHTVRAYQSDLSQFLDHAAGRAGVKRTALQPDHLDRGAIRAFLAGLHELGLARATAARKLAAARTFLRYLRREGVIDTDPGALIRTPKREVRMRRTVRGRGRVDCGAGRRSVRPPRSRDLELFYAPITSASWSD